MFLCYATENTLYFTSDPEATWGDDWDDAPYEHNAGPPYEDTGVKITKLMYISPYGLDLPHSGYSNSPFTVEKINEGKLVPWLEPSFPGKEESSLWAGATLGESVGFLIQQGAEVFTQLRVNLDKGEAEKDPETS